VPVMKILSHKGKEFAIHDWLEVKYIPSASPFVSRNYPVNVSEGEFTIREKEDMTGTVQPGLEILIMS